MADILLTVGVDTSVSLAEFRSGITSLVSQINSNPPKIKVQFDNKSLESMRKQIEMLQSTTTKNAAGGSVILPPTLTAQLQQEARAKQASAEAAKQKSAADREAAKAQKELEKEANKTNNAFSKATALYKQATLNVQKWNKAANGKSAEAYNNYKAQAEELGVLISRYNAGTISSKDFAESTSKIQTSLKQSESIIRQNGEATQTFASRVANLSQKFVTWFGITRIVMTGVQTIKKMANATIELDTAMTELKKVTNETDATYSKFLSTAAVRAKELGASLTDTVSATADFARLGFGIEEASSLADAATVYKNVGDGITDISTASESVISTMQAFGIEASDAMSIVDKFNSVGNNFAISSGGVGEALLRSASAMNAAGNTLDETIALVTAANTVVQNPESVGTTMKTMSMYLRAAKTEAEEAGESTEGMASSVSELRGEILELTGNKVDIQIDENTFKSTYEIIRELAGVWDELTDVSKANILEMVGGKRNANVTAALIENFELAEEVLKTSAGAAGSALEENEKYLDSINGKMNQLNASFQEMSSNFISSDLIKGLVDALRVLVELLNMVAETFGSLPTILATGAIAKFIFTVGKAGIHLKSFGSIVAGLQLAFPGLAKTITAVATAIAGAETGALSAGFSALASSIGISTAALGTFLGVAAGIAAVVIVTDLLTETFDEVQERAKESADAYNQVTSEIKSLEDEIKTTGQRIDELNAKDSLTLAEESELAKLNAANEQLNRQLEIKKQLQKYEQGEAASDANDVLTKKRSYQTGETQTIKGDEIAVYTRGDIIEETAHKQELLNSKQEEYNKLEAEMLSLNHEDANYKSKYDDYAKKLETLDKEMNSLTGDITSNLSIIDEQYGMLFDSDGNVLDGYEDVVDRANAVIDTAVESTSESANTVTEKIKHSTTDIATAVTKVKGLVSEIESVQSVLNSQSTGGAVSIEDLNSAELSDYRSALEYVNGTMQLNAEKVNEIVRAKTEEQIALNNTNKALAQADYLENAKQIAEYRKQLEEKTFASENGADAIQNSIDALLEENSALADACAQYDVMTSSLEQATSAYQHWLNAQNASQSGEMFDGALEALNKINDTLNNTDSDDYGRIGNEDYKAAIDFVVPDSVDKEDQDAVNKYIDSIYDYFIFDDKGNKTGLDIATFCENAVDAGLMVLDEAGENYQIAGGKTMEDFAEGLGLALPLVQAMFGEMEEFGGEFDWADEAETTFGDLAVKAHESAEALRELEGNENLDITLDLSGFETTEEQINALDATIAEMDGVKAKANVDSSEVEHANNVIQYCLQQKQLLSQPDIMRVDTSQVEGNINEAISLLQELQNAQNNLEIKSKIGADTSDAEAEVNSLVSQIQDKKAVITASLGEFDTSSLEAINQSIANISAEKLVKLGVDDSAIQGYNPTSKTCEVIYDPNTDLLPESFESLSRTVNYKANTKDLPSRFNTITRYVNYVAIGQHSLNGTAHAGGTARANGDWGTAAGGHTLVGELGREIVVDPRTGRWYTVGDAGAEFVNIPSGAIVFNHLQTESLLSQGFVSGRGHSLVSGTAMVTGGISKPQTNKSTQSSSSKPSKSSSKPTYSKKTTTKKKTSDKDDIEVIDWIEIAIERVERAIKRMSTTASSSFKKLSTRLSKTDKQIATVNEEIALQEKAKQEYLNEAANVNLSSGLKKKVREGTIDISEYSGKTADLIKEYQEWYEKALACSDAIQELHENVSELYEEEFNLVATDFDNQLSLLEHMSNAYENGLDGLEANGMLASTKYYEALRDTENEKLKIQKDELDALILKMSEAMSIPVKDGGIAKDSEAWYAMQQEINATKESIQESENAIDEFNNAIKETEWEHFDYLQERISAITAEADFLIELMSNSDLFEDNGQLSETGQATMALHTQNYNVYMAQADKYAEEIQKLNADLANDPNNTKLIERKEELLELQRESILSAEDEKQALIDLAEEGINRELEAMQELTESYKNALDEAKDLYDYQKRIKEKTSEVAKLRKQLSAYENDDSEETKAIKQRLEVSLKDAEENLEEAQYERYISEQKKLIDNLYSEYELILNERLDNVDALLNDIITATNSNAGTIKETLEAQVSAVGATLSESMNAIWSKEGGATSVVSTYGNAFTSQLTSVNTVLSAIAEKIGASVEESDKEAEEVIEDTTPSTDPVPVPKPEKTKPPTTPTTPKPTEKKIKKGGKINAKGAKIYDYKGDKSGERQYFRKDPIYKVLKIDGSWLQVRHHKLKSGITGWFKKGDVKAYKTGGLVDYTGLAWVDGQKKNPEAFLDAKDTKMFMSLRDALKEITDGNMSIPNVFADEYSGFDMDGIMDKMAKHSELQADSVRDIFYEINIPIDHVSDYNDFMNQLKNDNKFEKLIQSMTTDRLAGGSKLAKNKYKW